MILDSSGVDDVEVVDKCLTVLLRQLVLVLVLEKKTKKNNKSREIVLLLLHPFLLLLCFIEPKKNGVPALQWGPRCQVVVVRLGPIAT